MCKMASGFINPKTMAVKVAVLDSHHETAEKLGLKDTDRPNDWREMHYTPEGEVECRVLPQDSATAEECQAMVLATWPTFADFFSWAVGQGAGIEGTALYLGSLASADGLTIPEGVKMLYLGSLTSADGLTIPEGVKTLDLGSLTSADKAEICKKYPLADVW